MLKDREGALGALLLAIADATGPIGTRQARAALQDAGFPVSESSASRLLSELDGRGFTLPLDRKGRVVSPQGRQESRRYALRAEQAARRLDDVIDVRDVADLLDLLHARRAVESALAADAARNVDPEGVAELRALIQDHRRTVPKTAADSSPTQPGLHFHRKLAGLAKNRMIRSLANIVLDARFDNVEAVLDLLLSEQFAFRDGETWDVLGQHERLVDAIERGDVQAAEEDMRRHFDLMIESVETYLVGRKGGLFTTLLNWIEQGPHAAAVNYS